MIRTMLTLDVRPESVAAVLELYKARDILQYSLDHSEALASEISVAADGSNEVLITEVCPDAAAYVVWLSNPNLEKTSEGLADLLKDSKVGTGRIFEINHSVSK